MQTAERRNDRGTEMGIPVAFLLNPGNGVDFRFFERGMSEIGGVVCKISETVVKIKYKNRPTEIWMHPREQNYLDIYTKFCRSEFNVDLFGSYRDEGFVVDHSYNRASIPPDVDGYIRMFLVKAGPNSSWGAYYEQRLKELFLYRERIGLRQETVAIRAKLSGISAPRKEGREQRNLENVNAVVRQLVNLRMTSETQFDIDCRTLAAFCGMADGEYNGMTVSINPDGDTDVTPHEKNQ